MLEQPKGLVGLQQFFGLFSVAILQQICRRFLHSKTGGAAPAMCHIVLYTPGVDDP